MSEQQIESILTIGATAFLQLGLCGTGEGSQIRSAIRGWRDTAYISLDLPLALANTSKVKQGMGCTVRFLSQGTICGFATRVLEFDRAGAYPDMKVLWPRAFESVHMRRDERLSVMAPCTCRVEGGRCVAGQIRDLSAGGCSLQAAADFSSGQALKLDIDLPGGTVAQGITATVRNCRSLGGDMVLYGCQFDSRDEQGVREAAYFVHSSLECLRGRQANTPRVLIGSANGESNLCETRGWLIEKGYDVLVASTAVDVVFRTRAGAVDMVILGHDFPGMSGAALFTMLKQTPGYEQLPIALCVEPGEQPPACGYSPAELFASATPAEILCAAIERRLPLPESETAELA